MSYWKQYYLANSLSDALQVLASAEGKARVIAGGTDLLLDLQQRRHPPVEILIDINSVSEMNSIEIRDDRLFIGAAAPLSQIVSSPLVVEHALALNEAAHLIGGPQVRNTATLGGNIAHALPAADGAIALLALEAQAEIGSLSGRRYAPLPELYLSAGRSALQTGSEVLVGFYLQLKKKGCASAFRRVMRPQGVALPILNMAAWVQCEGITIGDLRIAVGPSGQKPYRAIKTEQVLRGMPYNHISLEEALTVILTETTFRTSPQRASAEYRKKLAGVLFLEILTSAWERASQDLAG
jgi:carbon-monoxide dehydrogenase medium subunit